MRRIVMFNRVTADGYFAGPDGGLDWIVPDQAVDRAAAEAIPGFDTFLFGRRTYELFERFWPRALQGAAAPDPHRPGRLSAEHRAMGAALNELSKLVFSRTLNEVTWSGSHLVHELDPRELQAIKQQPGKDMIILGSGSIVAQLTQHGLIDEYQLVVSPVVIGSGRALLDGLSRRSRLELLEARPYPSGNVMLRYAPT